MRRVVFFKRNLFSFCQSNKNKLIQEVHNKIQKNEQIYQQQQKETLDNIMKPPTYEESIENYQQHLDRIQKEEKDPLKRIFNQRLINQRKTQAKKEKSQNKILLYFLLVALATSMYTTYILYQNFQQYFINGYDSELAYLLCQLSYKNLKQKLGYDQSKEMLKIIAKMPDKYFEVPAFQDLIKNYLKTTLKNVINKGTQVDFKSFDWVLQIAQHLLNNRQHLDIENIKNLSTILWKYSKNLTKQQREQLSKIIQKESMLWLQDQYKDQIDKTKNIINELKEKFKKK